MSQVLTFTTCIYFRSGAIDRSDHQNSQKPKNPKQNDEISGKAQLPQTVTNYRNDSKEATPEEITRVYNTIRKLYHQDRKY